MRYRHATGCNYIGKHPDYKRTGPDGVPRVLMLDRITGGTVLEPCACWQERERVKAGVAEIMGQIADLDA